LDVFANDSIASGLTTTFSSVALQSSRCKSLISAEGTLHFEMRVDSDLLFFSDLKCTMNCVTGSIEIVVQSVNSNNSEQIPEPNVHGREIVLPSRDLPGSQRTSKHHSYVDDQITMPTENNRLKTDFVQLPAQQHGQFLMGLMTSSLHTKNKIFKRESTC
jgi:hypothetical protein